jgi:hypothetical protein
MNILNWAYVTYVQAYLPKLTKLWQIVGLSRKSRSLEKMFAL